MRIDEGKSGKTDLSGLNVAMLIDIPGRMSEGDWKAAGYYDDRADDAQFEALERIFTGQARGPTGLFRLLVSTYYGSAREEVRWVDAASDYVYGVSRAGYKVFVWHPRKQAEPSLTIRVADKIQDIWVVRERAAKA